MILEVLIDANYIHFNHGNRIHSFMYRMVRVVLRILLLLAKGTNFHFSTVFNNSRASIGGPYRALAADTVPSGWMNNSITIFPERCMRRRSSGNS